MRIIRLDALYGPNLYTTERAIRLSLQADVGLLAADSLSRDVARRLCAVLPADVSLSQGAEAADAQLSLAACVGRLCLCLQEEFGHRPRHCEVLKTARPGMAEIVYACDDPALGLLAGRLAVALVAQAVDPSSGDLAATYNGGLARLKRESLLVSTRCTLWEAERRGIPWSRIAHAEGMVRLGQGSKQRRLRGCYLHDTSYLGARLAINKAAASAVLRAGGVPVPDNRLVAEETAAVAAAEALGYPVVMKPNARDMGTAVSIGLADDQAVRAAYRRAALHGAVLVERQVTGLDYRVTVLHGRMIAAGCDIAAHLFGDGRSTVQALIDAVNRDPRRGSRDYCPLKTIRPDAMILETLRSQGYDLDSVPPAGERVALRRWWKPADDHMAQDFTGSVHPENRAMLERAARLVGLDMAGIDFITPDIARPWHEVGGAINEINPTPGMRTHVRAGAPDVHRILVDDLFPGCDDGRIPLVAVAGAPGAADVVRHVAALLAATGHTVGTASVEGAAIAGQRVLRNDATSPAGARLLLDDPLTTAAVVEVSDLAVAERGLGFDRATAVALMALPRSAAAARLLLGTASELAVLNAELPGVAAFAPASGAKRIAWVARDAATGPLPAHRAEGGLAVALGADGAACLWENGLAMPIPLPRPAAGDRLPLLFAIAVACGLGLSAEAIAEGFAAFGLHTAGAIS